MTGTRVENTDFGVDTSISGTWAIDSHIGAGGAQPAAVLVVTVSGREAMIEKVGIAETQQAVERCINRVLRVAEGFGGRVMDTRQNEITVSFDASDDALESAMEMQKRIAVLPPVSGIRMALQIGLSSGQAVEPGGFPDENVVATASSMARMAEAGQIVACIRAQAALSDDLRTQFDAYCLEWNNRRAVAVESSSEAVAAPAPEKASAPAMQTSSGNEKPAKQARGLRLKFGGHEFLVDDKHPVINIGRYDGNDVVLKGNHASRHHANITRRGSQVIFTDTSTNGTFVSFEDDPPLLLLVQRECVLHGTGVLSFSTADPHIGIGTASARFEVF